MKVLCVNMVTVFVMIVSTSLAESTFSKEEKQKLSATIAGQIKESQKWADHNQKFDIGFKVALLVLGILAAVGQDTLQHFIKTKLQTGCRY